MDRYLIKLAESYLAVAPEYNYMHDTIIDYIDSDCMESIIYDTIIILCFAAIKIVAD